MTKRITKTAKAKATKALKRIVAEHRAERLREAITKPAIDNRILLPELKWGAA